MGKALEGVRVIDMTHDQAGPSCTQILAWLGAEVIKIEMADGRGDRSRWLRRDDPDKDSYFYLLLNNNKKSTALNLKDPRGIEIFKELIKECDIMAMRSSSSIPWWGFPGPDFQAIVLPKWHPSSTICTVGPRKRGRLVSPKTSWVE